MTLTEEEYTAIYNRAYSESVDHGVRGGDTMFVNLMSEDRRRKAAAKRENVKPHECRRTFSFTTHGGECIRIETRR